MILNTFIDLLSNFETHKNSVLEAGLSFDSCASSYAPLANYYYSLPAATRDTLDLIACFTVGNITLDRAQRMCRPGVCMGVLSGSLAAAKAQAAAAGLDVSSVEVDG